MSLAEPVDGGSFGVNKTWQSNNSQQLRLPGQGFSVHSRVGRNERSSTGKSLETSVGATTSSSSVSASFARSFALLLGVWFKRPSRLFRPTRVDTLTSLRLLALESQQTLSPNFVRALVRERGPKALILSILPPLALNTFLGTLLFTSQTYFCYLLSRLSFFAPRPHPTQTGKAQAPNVINDSEGDGPPEWHSFSAEDTITFMESLHRLPHPTVMSAVAGMGAGVIQGLAFTPVENAVRILQRGTHSWLEAFSRVFGYSSAIEPMKPARLGIPKTGQDVKNFLGIGDGFVKAWQGAKWGISRDAVAYGVFFASFDISRRAGLETKAIVTRYLARGRDPTMKTDSMSTSGNDLYTSAQANKTAPAPTAARLAQAVCIVTGGISASLLAEFVSRPFRILEEIWKSQDKTAPGLQFKSVPTQGKMKPFVKRPSHIVRDLYRQEGLAGLFANPADVHLREHRRQAPLRTAQRISQRLNRLGWRLVGVAPWGIGFLLFTYIEGDI